MQVAVPWIREQFGDSFHRPSQPRHRGRPDGNGRSSEPSRRPTGGRRASGREERRPDPHSGCEPFPAPRAHSGDGKRRVSVATSIFVRGAARAPHVPPPMGAPPRAPIPTAAPADPTGRRGLGPTAATAPQVEAAPDPTSLVPPVPVAPHPTPPRRRPVARRRSAAATSAPGRGGRNGPPRGREAQRRGSAAVRGKSVAAGFAHHPSSPRRTSERRPRNPRYL